MSNSRVVRGVKGLRGEIEIPGDKSISHRSVMLGSIAEGKTVVTGFLQGEDNRATIGAFRSMGVSIAEVGDGVLHIDGAGLHGLKEPSDVIDCGNSGTTMRLISGLLSGQSFHSVLTGDQYLRKRPMKRVTEPLRSMGAVIDGREGGTLAPLSIRGGNLCGIDYVSPVASAQVKSALMLAGLYAEGETRIHEPHLSRDHSERMLTFFGVDVKPFTGGVSLGGGQELSAREVTVPGDISSAAFFLVAALIVPNSELLIKNVGINPTRNGIIQILKKMGGNIEIIEQRELSGEPVADLLVKSSSLKGIEIGGSLVPKAIDEFPVIAVAAAFAEGRTLITDAAELRVKETDRIAAMTSELKKLGVDIEATEDGMIIQGSDTISGGGVTSFGDHRIAMSMAIAALRASGSVAIQNIECTETSFPGFWDLLDSIIVK